MKRPTKPLSDIDVNGRIRRTGVEALPLVPAKFLDGPCAGQTLDVPRGADYVKIGTWKYSYAGKDGKMRVYCKHPKKRAEQKLLLFLIAKRGSDPRAEMSMARSKPTKRTAPTKHGQGARRRAEKRSATAA